LMRPADRANVENAGVLAALAARPPANGAAQIIAEGAAMGAPPHCPHCGAIRDDSADSGSLSAGQALEGLYHQVELIRKMAERSSRQSDEIRLLRETIARLRGTSSPQRLSAANPHEASAHAS
jgi:hypothetical protein